MLCARKCGVNRAKGQLGFCKSSSDVVVCRAEPHYWEEPIISGTKGSGAIFFGGCSLGCVFCQNYTISRGGVGKLYTAEELSEIMLDLQGRDVHNINLVTPTHFTPSVINAVNIAKNNGLMLPIIYNTGTYDSVDTINLLNDTVDVYLPDFKYFTAKTAAKLSYAENYPTVAKAAIAEMVKQQPSVVIENGIIKKGVIIRLLLLPGCVAEAKLSLKYLFETYGNSVYLSLMSQYTPISNMAPPLNRRVTKEEYRQLVDYAERIGVVNAFVQDLDSSTEDFIPKFNLTPILKKPSN